jgi:hypothetical protein
MAVALPACGNVQPGLVCSVEPVAGVGVDGVGCGCNIWGGDIEQAPELRAKPSNARGIRIDLILLLTSDA